MKSNEQQGTDNAVYTALTVYTAPYTKPRSITDAAYRKSTQEICNEITNHIGVEVPPLEVYTYMEAEGFTQVNMGSRLVWLLGNKTSPKGDVIETEILINKILDYE